MKQVAVLEAIRQTRNYLRDCRYHPELTRQHYAKARRFLGVDICRWGWLMRDRWANRLREIGLDPESLQIVDEFRWSVAWEMANDPDYARTFPIEHFRKRLALARLGEQLVAKENAPQSERRREVLSNLGIELD